MENYNVELLEPAEEVKEILKAYKYFYTNVDDDFCESNEGIFRLCADISDHLILYKNHEIIGDIDSKEPTYKIEYLNSKDNSIYSLEYINEGDSLMIKNGVDALNELLKKMKIDSNKYFCDISLDVDMGGIGFIDFKTEKALVENQSMWRGYGIDEAHGYDRYWQMLEQWKQGNSPAAGNDSPKNKQGNDDSMQHQTLDKISPVSDKKAKRNWWQFWK